MSDSDDYYLRLWIALWSLEEPLNRQALAFLQQNPHEKLTFSQRFFVLILRLVNKINRALLSSFKTVLRRLMNRQRCRHHTLQIRIPHPRKTCSSVVVNYNHSHFLPTSIEAILSQTRLPEEIIICDDASTDDSAEIIQKYASRHSLIKPIYKKQNGGLLAAVTTVTDAAKGDYLHQAAADDFMKPQFLEWTMEQAENYPQAGISVAQFDIYMRSHLLEETPFILGRGYEAFDTGFITPEAYNIGILPVMVLQGEPAPSTLFRTSVLKEFGSWPITIGVSYVSFMMHAAALKYGVAYTAQSGYIWYNHEENMTARDLKKFSQSLQIAENFLRLAKQAPFHELFPNWYLSAFASDLTQRSSAKYLAALGSTKSAS